MHSDASPPPPSDAALADWEITQITREVQFFADRHRDLFPYPAEHDLLQECLLHWVRRRGEYQGRNGASLVTFLKSVIRKQLIDVLRHALTEAPSFDRAMDSLERPLTADDAGSATLGDFTRTSSSDADPVQVAIDHELLAVLSELRATLTPEEDAVFTALVEERTLAVTARRLGRHPNTVTYQVDRLRVKLRRSALAEFLTADFS